ncbi:MAG: DedA family protein [Isosphaeraceae bacterium]
MTEALVGHFGYVGIALLLVLGGLGLPVPEEAPIILAAILSRLGKMWWPLALFSCLVGVLLGDFIVYFLGYFYGEKVLSLPLTRRFLTKARETQIQGYFHRHGFKILILGRFAVGFRTAAYLTAGILKLPVLRLFLIDLCAASLSTLLMFGLGFVFAHQIETALDQMKWVTAGLALVVGIFLLHRFFKARQRAGLPVGPKVLESPDVPLPPDDLHAHSGEFRSIAPVSPELPGVPRGVSGNSGSGIRTSPPSSPTTTPTPPTRPAVTPPASTPDSNGQATPHSLATSGERPSSYPPIPAEPRG